MVDITFTETMWAEMRPDVYRGENLDEHKPQWTGWAVGDTGEETINGDMELSPGHFPAGTKVSLSVPLCPKCGDSSDIYWDHDNGKSKDCGCGFSWKEWAEEQYS